MEPLSYDEFKVLAGASRRAFHLELKDTYNVAAEDEPFGRWQRGEPDDYAWHQDWLSFLRAATAAGVWVQRARVVSIPHTDYTRWGLQVARLNIEAGADIRYLPSQLTRDIDLPEEDDWLLDDDKLILSVFSADGRTGSFARSTSPQPLRQCLAVRDQVWDRAIPYAHYIAQGTSGLDHLRVKATQPAAAQTSRWRTGSSTATWQARAHPNARAHQVPRHGHCPS